METRGSFRPSLPMEEEPPQEIFAGHFKAPKISPNAHLSDIQSKPLDPFSNDAAVPLNSIQSKPKMISQDQDHRVERTRESLALANSLSPYPNSNQTPLGNHHVSPSSTPGNKSSSTIKFLDPSSFKKNPSTALSEDQGSFARPIPQNVSSVLPPTATAPTSQLWNQNGVPPLSFIQRDKPTMNSSPGPMNLTPSAGTASQFRERQSGLHLKREENHQMSLNRDPQETICLYEDSFLLVTCTTHRPLHLMGQKIRLKETILIRNKSNQEISYLYPRFYAKKSSLPLTRPHPVDKAHRGDFLFFNNSQGPLKDGSNPAAPPADSPSVLSNRLPRAPLHFPLAGP